MLLFCMYPAYLWMYATYSCMDTLHRFTRLLKCDLYIYVNMHNSYVDMRLMIYIFMFISHVDVSMLSAETIIWHVHKVKSDLACQTSKLIRVKKWFSITTCKPVRHHWLACLLTKTCRISNVHTNAQLQLIYVLSILSQKAEKFF